MTYRGQVREPLEYKIVYTVTDKVFFFFFFFLLIFLIFYIIYINMYIQNMKITRTITRKRRTETYSLKGKHKPVYNRFTILKLYHLLVFS